MVAGYDYGTIIIGTPGTQISSTTMDWMQIDTSVRALTPKEQAEQQRMKSLSNDRWKSTTTRNKTNMPVTRLLSTREKARLEKRKKKK